MVINSGVMFNYFRTIYTIKGWYDIERYDCIHFCRLASLIIDIYAPTLIKDIRYKICVYGYG